MKKLLFLLLFIPLISFSQIITDKKAGEFDIRTLKDKYITIEIDAHIFPSGHSFSSSDFKEITLRNSNRDKKWNVYDEGVKIRLLDKTDVLNFFAKYNYELVSTSSGNEGGVIVNNVVISDIRETLTLINNNIE